VTRPEPSVDPRIETAYAEFQAGKLDAARTGYTRVLREDPGHRDALLGLAAIETREQRSEVAEALYQRLLQADPRDAHAQAGLLSLRAGQIDPVAAESRLKSLLSSDPDSGVLHAALGNQYALQGRWPEAQQAYFRAYSAEPDNPDLAYNLAVSLDHLRQAALAAEYYRRAIALGAKRPFSFDTASARQRAEALAR
jgi:tetratricopeptide (TPR) repeat protein